MAPIDAGSSLQGNRKRPSAGRPIIPVIPLPYIQKRKQHATTPKKIEEVPVLMPSADMTTTKPPSVTGIVPATSRGNVDATGDVEVGVEPSQATSVTIADEDGVGAPVDEVQGATADTSSAGKYQSLSL